MRFSACIAATLAVTVASGVYASTVSVTGPAAANAGDTISVAVSLPPDLSGVYALQAGLSYDPSVLTPVAGQDAGVAQGFFAGTPGNTFPGETIPKDADLFRMNAGQAGLLLFGYVKNPGDPAGSPSITVPANALRISFTVAADASGVTTVQLSPYAVNGQDVPALLLGAKDGSPLAADVGDALNVSITPTRRPGDANNDGSVTVADVLLQLQAIGGFLDAGDASFHISNGDVWPPTAAAGPDGVITLEDAVRTLRFVNGLETTLN